MLFRSTYQGKNRVERAERFARAVQDAGSVTRLCKTSGVGHELPPRVIDDAVRFLSASVDADVARTGAHAVRVLPADPGENALQGVATPGLPAMLSTPPPSRTSTVAQWPREVSGDTMVTLSSFMPLQLGRIPDRIAPTTGARALDPSNLLRRLVGRYIAQ